MDASELDGIRGRVLAASPGPWKAYVEGRDHSGGDNFIMISEGPEDDMYVSRATSSGPKTASDADLDFIAGARQDVAALLEENRELRARLGEG